MKVLNLILNFLLLLIIVSCVNNNKEIIPKHNLKVSTINPHLLETADGKPVFLNNFTAWGIIRKASRNELEELIGLCKSNKYNTVSSVVLGEGFISNENLSVYCCPPFESDSDGNPDPLKPILTPSNNPDTPGEYDYWNHVDYLVGLTASKGIYLCLHPAWGSWFSGGYSGERSGERSKPVIFNETNAYQYGYWLGKRYGDKKNIIWMLGGDRSAVYDSQTYSFSGRKSRIVDTRPVYRAIAEGLADGTNGINNQDGSADFSSTVISFHPRKWAPNSSEWFHYDPWLDFNSIQDTPYDQIVSVPHDYELQPTKPTWLLEGRYEGKVSAWGVRCQAYQTVFAGAFGHTYGCYEIFEFPLNLKRLGDLPAFRQMGYLYYVTREIWSDPEFLNRRPAQELIVGDAGSTFGDGDVATNGTEEGAKIYVRDAGSDRITAMCSKNGDWAMAYIANGREFKLDLQKLSKEKFDAYWFNPRNGKWYMDGEEFDNPTPCVTKLAIGGKISSFDPPGEPGRDNDWVLILK